MKGLYPFQVYKAMSLHFNDKVNYDCLKYNFKTKANEESFMKSSFRWQYVGFEKKYGNGNIRYIMFGIFEKNDFGFVHEKGLNQIAKFVYQSPAQFISSAFENDLQYLKKVYNGNTSLFDSDGLYPNVYRELKDNNIEYQTFMLLNCFIYDVLNTDSRDIIAWPKFVKKCQDIVPFIMLFFDRSDVEQVFKEHYLD